MGKHDDQQDQRPQLSDDASGCPDLGSQVYRRYSVDPGVARSTSGFGLGESMARFAFDRLGLVNEIQPRWKTTNSPVSGAPQVDRIWSAGRSPFGSSHAERPSSSPLLSRAAAPGAVPALPELPGPSLQRATIGSTALPVSGIDPIAPVHAPTARAIQRSTDSSSRSADQAGTAPSAISKGSFNDRSSSTPAFRASPAGRQGGHTPLNEASGGGVMRSSAGTARTGSQVPPDSTAVSNSGTSARPQANSSAIDRTDGRGPSNEPQPGIVMRSRDSRVTPETTQLSTAERSPVNVQPPIISRAARRSAQLQRQPQREEIVPPVSEGVTDRKQRSAHDLPILQHADHDSSRVNRSPQGNRGESGATPQSKVPLDSRSTGSLTSVQGTVVGAEQITSTHAESIAKTEIHPSVPSSPLHTKSNLPQPIATPLSGQADPVWRKLKDAKASPEAPSPQGSSERTIQRAALPSVNSSKAASSPSIPDEPRTNKPSSLPGSASIPPQSSLVQIASPANIPAPSPTFHPSHRGEQINSTEISHKAAASQTHDESPKMIARTATHAKSMDPVATNSSPREIIAATQPVWRASISTPAESLAASSAVAGPSPSMLSEVMVARKTSVSSDSSRQGEIAQAAEIEEIRPLPRVPAELAAKPEAPEMVSHRHRTMGPQATGQVLSAASSEYGSAGVPAAPKTILQRSAAGPISGQSERGPAQSHPPVSSSPVVVKPLPVAAESAPASIHRSADSRNAHAADTAASFPSHFNNSVDFPSAAVHRVATGGSYNSPSTPTGGGERHSAASYPANLMVQRSSSPAGGSTAAPAVPPAPSLPTIDANQPASPAVNITQLANRVYDLLVRRLASEQQRRGA